MGIIGQTALLTAVQNIKFQSVQKLLELGATTTAVDYMRRSALHLSAGAGDFSIQITNLLLSRGGCAETCDAQNMTPLHYAIWAGSEQTAEALLRAGVCINAGVERRRWIRTTEGGRNGYSSLPEGRGFPQTKDVDGLTPLHWAALIGHPAMTEYLLFKGANPNAHCKNGETPLHLALRRRVIQDYDDAWNHDLWMIEVLKDFIGDHEGDDADEMHGRISEMRIDSLLSHVNINVDLQNYQMQAPLTFGPLRRA